MNLYKHSNSPTPWVAATFEYQIEASRTLIGSNPHTDPVERAEHHALELAELLQKLVKEARG